MIYVSQTGCTTSKDFNFPREVESDWTPNSARILGKLPIIRVCTDRPIDPPKPSFDSKLNPKPAKPLQQEDNPWWL